MPAAKRKYRWLVADFETDPFVYGKTPRVFLAGLCDGEKCIQWWGDNCLEAFMEYLQTLTPAHYVYFHNGGKFDFLLLPKGALHGDIKIISGRIVSAKLGRHTLRDSFAILPFGLAKYKKTEIDYSKFERGARDSHRQEIESYHRDDLLSLYELVGGFLERFGLRLTIAGTAIKELLKIHPVERKGESHDQKFRKFYHGGRVQCFERGALRGKWNLYDVNSMYPYAMANYNHPVGGDYEFCCDAGRLMRDNAPGFITFTGISKGAFPCKHPETLKLEFPRLRGQFSCSLHELREAHSLGLVEVETVEEGWLSGQSGNFAEFVRLWYEEKRKAEETKDTRGKLFAKLILNSAYGKFAANPELYFDYKFLFENDRWPGPDWEPYEDYGWLVIARRPAAGGSHSYFDVATAASITGAARALLMRALHYSKRPIYCDTDSIICESLAVDTGSELGKWKIECEADHALILGKKLYCLTKNGEVVKKASKGVQMELKDYLAVIGGKDYIYSRDAPSFKKDGSAKFIQRTITGVPQ